MTFPNIFMNKSVQKINMDQIEFDMIKGNKINGNQICKKLLAQLKEKIIEQQQKQYRFAFKEPKLGIILAGHDPASLSYINKKITLAKSLGVLTELYKIKSTNYQDADQEIQQLIRNLNQDQSHHGIIIQLPLSQVLKQKEKFYLNLVDPIKDVDCLTSKNSQELQKWGDKAPIMPCTPYGVLKMLQACNIEFEHKKVLVIGRGKLTGAPLMRILSSHVENLTNMHRGYPLEEVRSVARQSDIIFSATGKRDILTHNDIKEGSVVIDIGICSEENNPNKMRGDIAEHVKEVKTSLYSPMPGGVGPMTVYALMENVYKLWCMQRYRIQS